MELGVVLEEIDRVNFEITKKVSHKIKEGIPNTIGHPHLYLLMYIKNEGKCKVTDIAKHLGITLSAVTNLTNKLLEIGLITRERGENDRRVVVIDITAEGEKVLQKLMENRKNILGTVFRDLSEQEIDVLRNIFNKILKTLKRDL